MNTEVDISQVKLETERLILRPWKMEDVYDFYEYAKVDGVGQMAGWNPHKTIQESKNILQIFMDGKNDFAVEFKENHKVIGSLGLEELSIDLHAPYNRYKGREIGYVLSKEYWGRGLMAEAVKEVIKYLFEEEQYDFLLVCHASTNIQSKRVIEKCDFHFVTEQFRTEINGETNLAYYYILDNQKEGNALC